MEPVTLTRPRAQPQFGGRGVGRSGLRGDDGLGRASPARGEEVQNHTPAITAAETTLAIIRPNALRMFALPTLNVGQRVVRPPRAASINEKMT